MEGERDVVRGKWHAIMPRHTFAQVEGVSQAVGADLIALGQIRNPLERTVLLHDQCVHEEVPVEFLSTAVRFPGKEGGDDGTALYGANREGAALFGFGNCFGRGVGGWRSDRYASCDNQGCNA